MLIFARINTNPTKRGHERPRREAAKLFPAAFHEGHSVSGAKASRGPLGAPILSASKSLLNGKGVVKARRSPDAIPLYREAGFALRANLADASSEFDGIGPPAASLAHVLGLSVARNIETASRYGNGAERKMASPNAGTGKCGRNPLRASRAESRTADAMCPRPTVGALRQDSRTASRLQAPTTLCHPAYKCSNIRYPRDRKKISSSFSPQQGPALRPTTSREIPAPWKGG